MLFDKKLNGRPAANVARQQKMDFIKVEKEKKINDKKVILSNLQRLAKQGRIHAPRAGVNADHSCHIRRLATLPDKAQLIRDDCDRAKRPRAPHASATFSREKATSDPRGWQRNDTSSSVERQAKPQAKSNEERDGTTWICCVRLSV